MTVNICISKLSTLEGLEGKHHPLHEQSYFTLTGVVFAKSGWNGQQRNGWVCKKKKILFLKLLLMVMESKYAEYTWCEMKWIKDASHLSNTSEKELCGYLVTVCHFSVDTSLLSTDFHWKYCEFLVYWVVSQYDK